MFFNHIINAKLNRFGTFNTLMAATDGLPSYIIKVIRK
jgi:hypothetical protein